MLMIEFASSIPSPSKIMKVFVQKNFYLTNKQIKTPVEEDSKSPLKYQGKTFKKKLHTKIGKKIYFQQKYKRVKKIHLF